MRKAIAATVMLGCMVAGCDGPSEHFPEPAPLRSQLGPDPGFPIKPRPGCSAVVLAALRDPEPEAIARVASQGGDFTCGPAFDPTPLDEAVMNDAPTLVRALLEARADPNARWSSHGDRFPLQDAIEARAYGWPHTHRAEIVRLLLRHGADPNSRWCPFESRGTDAGLPPCNSKWGVTPLIMAAALDQADVTYLLLDARADPTLEDSAGRSALDYARSEAVFELLLPPPSAFDLGLSRLDSARAGGGQPRFHGRGAVASRDSTVVEMLLTKGADPNARWCVTVQIVRSRDARPLMPGCERERGMTPLMLAASLGAEDTVRVLVQHGADPTLRDWQDKTALDHAEPANSRGVAGTLGVK